MNFSWDENKRQSNLIKHGVDFADTVGAFYDDFAITTEDPDQHGEQPLITLGVSFNMQLVLVTYGHREDDTIHLISARKANRREHQQYKN